MPAKNALKTYTEGGYYHVYNRGVNKRTIFKDAQDSTVFLSYLKTYLLAKDVDMLNKMLSSPDSSPKEKNHALNLLHLNNFQGRITLLAYCLMSNHFHFLISQTGRQDMETFMKSLMTRYLKYFNYRHGRVGPLFQGRYKAVLISSDEQLLYLTRYIHRNPFELPETLRDQQPSSYRVYLGQMKQEWVQPSVVLANFAPSGFNSYQSFVESTAADHEVQAAALLAPVSIDGPAS